MPDIKNILQSHFQESEQLTKEALAMTEQLSYLWAVRWFRDCRGAKLTGGELEEIENYRIMMENKSKL